MLPAQGPHFEGRTHVLRVPFWLWLPETRRHCQGSLLVVISSGSSCGSLLGRVPSENQGYWVFSLTHLGRNRPGCGGRTVGTWKQPSLCSGPQQGTSGSQLGPLGLHEGKAGAKIVVCSPGRAARRPPASLAARSPE